MTSLCATLLLALGRYTGMSLEEAGGRLQRKKERRLVSMDDSSHLQYKQHNYRGKGTVTVISGNIQGIEGSICEM